MFPAETVLKAISIIQCVLLSNMLDGAPEHENGAEVTVSRALLEASRTLTWLAASYGATFHAVESGIGIPKTAAVVNTPDASLA